MRMFSDMSADEMKQWIFDKYHQYSSYKNEGGRAVKIPAPPFESISRYNLVSRRDAETKIAEQFFPGNSAVRAEFKYIVRQATPKLFLHDDPFLDHLTFFLRRDILRFAASFKRIQCARCDRRYNNVEGTDKEAVYADSGKRWVCDNDWVCPMCSSTLRDRNNAALKRGASLIIIA